MIDAGIRNGWKYPGMFTRRESLFSFQIFEIHLTRLKGIPGTILYITILNYGIYLHLNERRTTPKVISEYRVPIEIIG